MRMEPIGLIRTALIDIKQFSPRSGSGGNAKAGRLDKSVVTAKISITQDREVFMKELFQYYAQCNAKVNRDMLEVLEKNIQEPLTVALDGYFFLTLGQLLEHIYIADMNWMTTFLSAGRYDINLEAMVGPVPQYGHSVFSNFKDYKEARGRLDEAILRFTAELGEGDLAMNVTRINKKGEKTEKVLWKALLHFFNHQTHHRGQVSNILDGMKIENDYSNMIRI